MRERRREGRVTSWLHRGKKSHNGCKVDPLEHRPPLSTMRQWSVTLRRGYSASSEPSRSESANVVRCSLPTLRLRLAPGRIRWSDIWAMRTEAWSRRVTSNFACVDCKTIVDCICVINPLEETYKRVWDVAEAHVDRVVEESSIWLRISCSGLRQGFGHLELYHYVMSEKGDW